MQSKTGQVATVSDDAKRLLDALESNLSKPSDSKQLTDEELAVFDELTAAVASQETASAICDEFAQYANLSNPEQARNFLRDFASWIDRQRSERKARSSAGGGKEEA
jgi:hypothetical protein